MRIHSIVLTLALCAAACSNDDANAPPQKTNTTAQATAKPAAPSPPPPSKPEAPKPADAADVRPAMVPANSLGVSMTLKPGAMEGTSYKTKAEVLNKGQKEISAVYWTVCGFDADGKLRDDKTVNGGDASVKPGGKGEIEVYVAPHPRVGFLVTSVKYADGSTKEAEFAERSCPSSVKP